MIIPCRFSGRDEVDLRSTAVTDTEYGTLVKYSWRNRTVYLEISG
jgi:hypothetical protein